MSSAITCTDCTSISFLPGKGFGPDFGDLKKIYKEKVIDRLRETETIGRSLEKTRRLLQEVFQECSDKNWDGYNALPVTEDAYYEADKLLEMLPSSIPMPDEITPEPDGCISLEWYKGKRMLFSISLSGNYEIVYAGLFGPDKDNGTAYFGVSLPKKIVEKIQVLYS